MTVRPYIDVVIDHARFLCATPFGSRVANIELALGNLLEAGVDVGKAVPGMLEADAAAVEGLYQGVLESFKHAISAHKKGEEPYEALKAMYRLALAPPKDLAVIDLMAQLRTEMRADPAH